MLLCNPGVSWLKFKALLHIWRARRDRRKRLTTPDRWLGGRCNKQGDLHMWFALGSHKMNRSLHILPSILRVYIEALKGFSHIFSPDGLNNRAHSRGCALEVAPCVGLVGRAHSPRTEWGGGGVGAPSCPGPAWGSVSSLAFWMTSSTIKAFCTQRQPLHLSHEGNNSPCKFVVKDKGNNKWKRKSFVNFLGLWQHYWVLVSLKTCCCSSNLCCDIWLILGASLPFSDSKSCTTLN